MRVLHLGKFFPPFSGGMETFLADLLGALERRGVSSAALVHDHHRRVRGQRSAAPLVYRAPCFGRLLYAPLSPSFPLWLQRALHEFQPDLLHLHLPNTSAFWVLASRAARRVPWLIHWHSDVVASRLERRLALAYPFYRPLEQRLLAASRAIITTSPSYLASSRALQAWRSKCHTIALGLDPKRLPTPDKGAFIQARRLWGHGQHPRPLRILAVGRLTYYKGFDGLLAALALLPDARLVIAGSGERYAHLHRLVESLRLSDRVALPGAQSSARLSALFASCDLLCLPSLERTEAFGMVLLEAMHFAKPVVVSDIAGSGVGWVVGQAGHGVLVPPNNPQALAKALARLAQNPKQRLALGASGARALAATFHIERIAQQTLALYERVLSEAH